MKLGILGVALGTMLFALPSYTGISAQTTAGMAPIAIRGCAPVSGTTPQNVNVSVENTSGVEANVIIVQIGDTGIANFTRVGPHAVSKWRLATPSGPCAVRSARFSDGSIWVSPVDVPSTVTSANP